MTMRAGLDDALTGLLLQRALPAFPEHILSGELATVLARCRRRSSRIIQDAAALLAAAGCHAGSAGLTPTATAGLTGWLTDLETSDALVHEVWQEHRGAVLFALDYVAGCPVAWGLPEAAGARSALLDVLLFECRRQVADRHGTSFRVFERSIKALSILLATAGEGPAHRLLVEVEARLPTLCQRQWSEVRQWAGGLRQHGWHWPGEALPPSDGPSPVVPPALEVPFGILCGRPPRSVVRELARMFRAAAGADLRLYDRAPLAVAFTALLLDELKQCLGREPIEWDSRLPELAARDWALPVEHLAQAWLANGVGVPGPSLAYLPN
jgi:hypothetical protein